MTNMPLFAEGDKWDFHEFYTDARSEESLVWRILDRDKNIEFRSPPLFVRKCESPIERVLAWALLKFQCCANGEIELYPGGDFVFEGCTVGNVLHWLETSKSPCLAGVGACQVTVGPYRVDFLLATQGLPRGSPPYLLAVECDGHDFHEKTKTQAARDKARDRNLAEWGVQTIRFTGAEIWRDPEGCAHRVYQILSAYQERFEILREKAHG